MKSPIKTMVSLLTLLFTSPKHETWLMKEYDLKQNDNVGERLKILAFSFRLCLRAEFSFIFHVNLFLVRKFILSIFVYKGLVASQARVALLH